MVATNICGDAALDDISDLSEWEVVKDTADEQ